jgi:hypothetical protein
MNIEIIIPHLEKCLGNETLYLLYKEVARLRFPPHYPILAEFYSKMAFINGDPSFTASHNQDLPFNIIRDLMFIIGIVAKNQKIDLSVNIDELDEMWGSYLNKYFPKNIPTDIEVFDMSDIPDSKHPKGKFPLIKKPI